MNEYLKIYGDLMRLPDKEKHLFFCRLLHDNKYLIPFFYTKETLQELLIDIAKYQLTNEDFENFIHDWQGSPMQENVNQEFYKEFICWCNENIKNFDRQKKLLNLLAEM